MISELMRTTLVLLTAFTLAACSVAAPATAAITPEPSVLPATPAVTAVPSPTAPAAARSELPPFPACTGMQRVQDPVHFDWPNLDSSMEQFIPGAWEYHSCEQPPSEVARLYREQLTKAPYGLWEANWLEREEGTLGIYFSESGLWYYVWFLDRPGDAQGSYVVVSESFASVDC